MKLTTRQKQLAKNISLANHKPLRHGVKLVMRREARRGHALTMYGSRTKAQSYFMI